MEAHNNAKAVALPNWLVKNDSQTKFFLQLTPQRDIAAGERWDRIWDADLNSGSCPRALSRPSDSPKVD
jgi:hypothetical protein